MTPKPPIELAREMLAGLEGVTPGEWEADHGIIDYETGGEHIQEDGPWEIFTSPYDDLDGSLIAVTGRSDRGRIEARHVARCSKPNIEAITTSYLEMVEALEQAEKALKMVASQGADVTSRLTIASSALAAGVRCDKALATARGEQ